MMSESLPRRRKQHRKFTPPDIKFKDVNRPRDFLVSINVTARLLRRPPIYRIVVDPDEKQPTPDVCGEAGYALYELGVTENGHEYLIWPTQWDEKYERELNLQRKLSDEDKQIIRDHYETGYFSQAKLGLEFGVSQNHISRIVRGVKKIRRKKK